MTELKEIATARIKQIESELAREIEMARAYHQGRVDEVKALLANASQGAPAPADGDMAQPADPQPTASDPSPLPQ